MTTTTQPPAVGSELCSSTCDPCGYSFSLQHPFGQIDAVKIGGETKTCNTHGQRPKLTQDSVMQYCRENACSRARHDPELRVEPSTTAERNVRGAKATILCPRTCPQEKVNTLQCCPHKANHSSILGHGIPSRELSRVFRSRTPHPKIMWHEGREPGTKTRQTEQ